MLKRILSLTLSLMLCSFPAMGAKAGADPKDFLPPGELPEQENLPELLRFLDGSPVKTPEDWQRRREELLALYSYYMYGYMPERANESLRYSITDDEETGGKLLEITVEANGNTASFTVLVTLPEGAAPEGGFPYFVEYMPHHYQSWFTGEWVTEASANCRLAASRGYAGINYDPSQVAADNASHTGAFYTLYPYKLLEPDSRNGVLLAWAWGVSKVIDALEMGAGQELGIAPELSLVGGVSRYGKSVAVAGAYDQRIKVVIPSCSGAGGMATYRTGNSGKTYDLTSLGGDKAWVNQSANEPLSNLQGGEGYWFCGRFCIIPSAQAIPVDQHMLAALVASPDRHLIVVTGIVSEGWNNTEGQCLAWAASKPAWKLLGCEQNTHMLIHLDGHAILPGDMQYILDYCDVRLLGKDPALVESDFSKMQGNLFLQENKESLHPFFAPYLE